MRRLLNTILLFAIVIFIAGCSEDTPTISEEFERISEEIPGSFSKDIQLPDSEYYQVDYFIDGTLLEDRILRFVTLDIDKTIYFSLEISDGENIKEYFFQITQLGDPDLSDNGPVLDMFDRMFLYVKKELPYTMTSNTTLPESNNDDVTLSYRVDCSTIVRGRIVYLFPEDTIDCLVEVDIIYQNELQTKLLPIMMSSLDDLPKVPEIRINTFGAEIPFSKEYVSATFSMTLGGTSAEYSYNNEELIIRKRGNSTLFMPKGSYKLKFDNKVNLLNSYAEKDWVLLANHSDRTLIRNYLAFSLSGRLGMEFTPSVMFVDLYINDEYAGNYMLTDQIEVSNDRVDIEENSPDIDTGYLLEYDIGLYREGLENTSENYFIFNDFIPFVIKSPSHLDPHYSVDQKNYIESYMSTVLTTLQEQRDYSSLIDEDSFIDWFIISEIFKNVDSGYSSVYYYKDKGGLLKMGPVWDFDLSSMNQGHTNSYDRSPEGFYTSRQDKNIIFYHLMQYDGFRENLKDRWNEIIDDEIMFMLDEVFIVSDSITHSRYQNFERWNTIWDENDWYTSPEVFERKTYDEQIYLLYDYLDARIFWLDEEINAF